MPGPPDAPSQFTLDDVGEENVTVSWVTGYDYNSTQTFVILVHEGAQTRGT